MPLDVTDATFDAEVLQSDKTVIVDFWAPWCGPCRILGPILDDIANDFDTIKVVKVNVDDNEEVASRYGILSIPTLMRFDDGKNTNKMIGVAPRPRIESELGLNG